MHYLLGKHYIRVIRLSHVDGANRSLFVVETDNIVCDGSPDVDLAIRGLSQKRRKPDLTIQGAL